MGRDNAPASVAVGAAIGCAAISGVGAAMDGVGTGIGEIERGGGAQIDGSSPGVWISEDIGPTEPDDIGPSTAPTAVGVGDAPVPLTWVCRSGPALLSADNTNDARCLGASVSPPFTSPPAPRPPSPPFPFAFPVPFAPPLPFKPPLLPFTPFEKSPGALPLRPPLEGGGFIANSCAPGVGGGRKEEEGEGNGDADEFESREMVEIREDAEFAAHGVKDVSKLVKRSKVDNEKGVDLSRNGVKYRTADSTSYRMSRHGPGAAAGIR